MTPIQALLFDADGVVVHPNRFAAYSNVDAARAYGWHAEQYVDFATFQAAMQGSIEVGE